jgi:hypothetical protein
MRGGWFTPPKLPAFCNARRLREDGLELQATAAKANATAQPSSASASNAAQLSEVDLETGEKEQIGKPD